MEPVPLNIAFEDPLSEALLDSILAQSGRLFCVGGRYSRGGYGYLKSRIRAFNSASRVTPFLVLTDLDNNECAPRLKTDWLAGRREHPNLLFRVAVREVEAWVMADREAFSNFLGIRVSRLPQDLDSVTDPKRLLLALTRQSRRRQLREAILPPSSSSRTQGPDYNARLIEFVWSHWRLSVARSHSLSLRRAENRLKCFVPTWAAGS